MKLPVLVFANKWDWSGDIFYSVHSRQDSCSGVCIAETEIEIPDPNRADIINGTVKILRVRQQSIRADAELAVQKIEQEIGELLAIEDRSAA